MVPDLEPLLTSRWELSQYNPCSLESLELLVELPLSAAQTGVPAFVLTLFLSPACPLAACLCWFPSLPEGRARERAHRGCRVPSCPDGWRCAEGLLPTPPCAGPTRLGGAVFHRLPEPLCVRDRRIDGTRPVKQLNNMLCPAPAVP